MAMGTLHLIPAARYNGRTQSEGLAGEFFNEPGGVEKLRAMNTAASRFWKTRYGLRPGREAW